MIFFLTRLPRLWCEAVSVLCEKQGGLFGVGQEVGSHVGEVFLGPLDGPLAYRHYPVGTALALADQQHSALRLQISDVQLARLLASDAAGVKHLDEGPVPDAEPFAQVDVVQDLLYLGASSNTGTTKHPAKCCCLPGKW